MSREHRFATSNKFGKSGEREVLEFLSNTLPNLKQIKDVSNDPEYQRIDIDAIICFNDGSEYSIEIKTDSYSSTGNMAFEIWSSISDQIPGCMFKTECDYLFYYFPESGELYQLKMNEYRNWVEKNAENFKTISVRNVSWGKEYFSTNYLIPKSMLKATFKHYIYYNLKKQ